MPQSASESARIAIAVELLVQARRTGRLLEGLPAFAKPISLTESLAVQEATAAALGATVRGWKVAGKIDGQLLHGAILDSVLYESPAIVPAASAPMLGVEAEIAFRFDRDMPPRASDYSAAEVAGAVTAFPAIEVVSSRFRDYAGTAPLDRAADFVSNGAFVRGEARADWREFDLTNIEVTLAIGGSEIVRRKGGHSSGDPLLPAIALVNDLRRGPGVKAGQVVTTGTYTGLNFARPGHSALVAFTGFGSVEVRFAA